LSNPIIYMNEGLQAWVKNLLGAQPPFGLSARLFSNVFTPQPTTKFANFVEPVSLTGYRPVALAASSWNVSADSGIANADYPNIIWNFPSYSGPVVSLVGWWICEPRRLLAVMAKLFPSPILVPKQQSSLTMGFSLDASQFSG